MSSTTAERAVQEEREINRIPEIHNAIEELWVRAAPGLSEKELEWFAQCGDGAELALRNMSDAIEFIGCRMASDEKSGNFEDTGSVAALLLFLAESLRGISAQVFLMDFANNGLRFGKISK